MKRKKIELFILILFISFIGIFPYYYSLKSWKDNYGNLFYSDLVLYSINSESILKDSNNWGLNHYQNFSNYFKEDVFGGRFEERDYINLIQSQDLTYTFQASNRSLIINNASMSYYNRRIFSIFLSNNSANMERKEEFFDNLNSFIKLLEQLGCINVYGQVPQKANEILVDENLLNFLNMMLNLTDSPDKLGIGSSIIVKFGVNKRMFYSDLNETAENLTISGYFKYNYNRDFHNNLLAVEYRTTSLWKMMDKLNINTVIAEDSFTPNDFLIFGLDNLSSVILAGIYNQAISSDLPKYEVDMKFIIRTLVMNPALVDVNIYKNIKESYSNQSDPRISKSLYEVKDFEVNLNKYNIELSTNNPDNSIELYLEKHNAYSQGALAYSQLHEYQLLYYTFLIILLVGVYILYYFLLEKNGAFYRAEYEVLRNLGVTERGRDLMFILRELIIFSWAILISYIVSSLVWWVFEDGAIISLDSSTPGLFSWKSITIITLIQVIFNLLTNLTFIRKDLTKKEADIEDVSSVVKGRVPTSRLTANGTTAKLVLARKTATKNRGDYSKKGHSNEFELPQRSRAREIPVLKNQSILNRDMGQEIPQPKKHRSLIKIVIYSVVLFLYFAMLFVPIFVPESYLFSNFDVILLIFGLSNPLEKNTSSHMPVYTSSGAYFTRIDIVMMVYPILIIVFMFLFLKYGIKLFRKLFDRIARYNYSHFLLKTRNRVYFFFMKLSRFGKHYQKFLYLMGIYTIGYGFSIYNGISSQQSYIHLRNEMDFGGDMTIYASTNSIYNASIVRQSDYISEVSDKLYSNLMNIEGVENVLEITSINSRYVLNLMGNDLLYSVQGFLINISNYLAYFSNISEYSNIIEILGANNMPITNLTEAFYNLEADNHGQSGNYVNYCFISQDFAQSSAYNVGDNITFGFELLFKNKTAVNSNSSDPGYQTPYYFAGSNISYFAEYKFVKKEFTIAGIIKYMPGLAPYNQKYFAVFSLNAITNIADAENSTLKDFTTKYILKLNLNQGQSSPSIANNYLGELKEIERNIYNLTLATDSGLNNSVYNIEENYMFLFNADYDFLEIILLFHVIMGLILIILINYQHYKKNHISYMRKLVNYGFERDKVKWAFTADILINTLYLFLSIFIIYLIFSFMIYKTFYFSNIFPFNFFPLIFKNANLYEKDFTPIQNDYGVACLNYIFHLSPLAISTLTIIIIINVTIILFILKKSLKKQIKKNRVRRY
ncbi:MAG: ABC transporter permease [Promethearchaeota archaeon]